MGVVDNQWNVRGMEWAIALAGQLLQIEGLLVLAGNSGF